jgi:hypothetical protein
MEVNKLLGKLKPFENKTVLVSNYQDSADIIKEIIKAHAKYASEYDKISPYFWKGNVKDTCKHIFKYLKKNVQYDIEPDTKQTVKSPSAIIAQGYGDCKHYSLFIAGILDSLRRSGKNINWSYRFANYKLFARTPHHVFCVANPKTKNEIWVDPVLEFFDNKKPYVNAVDKNYKQMALYSISGIGNQFDYRRRQRRAYLIYALKKRLNFLISRGWNDPQNPNFKKFEFLQNRINRLTQISGFNQNLNLHSVAGIGCCDGVGYTAAERKKDLNRLWHKMQNYKRLGWNKLDSPYYNEYYITVKEYRRVRTLPTMNGDDFTATTSIEGIGRRSRAERRERRRARREARRSGPNCKGRLGPKLALTIPRKAFLALVRVNFRKIGQKLHIALQNPEAAAKIYKKWCGLGGNAALLRRAATKAYEKAKRKGKVDGIGFAPAAIAAWWAAASPVIAAIMPVIALAVKLVAPGSKGAEAAETASEATSALQQN